METTERSRLVREYVEAKKFADSAAKRADELKRVLRQVVMDDGKPDDRGSVWCPAGDWQLKHERRVSERFDTEAAEQWARDNGYWESLREVTVTERLNEDALMALGWENPEISPIIASFYKETETWAFKVVEQKGYDNDDE